MTKWDPFRQLTGSEEAIIPISCQEFSHSVPNLVETPGFEPPGVEDLPKGRDGHYVLTLLRNSETSPALKKSVTRLRARDYNLVVKI